ncbi:MAG: small ribosomal subunit biogenesis GTPase RsgA [Proteobacteria bacterium]|nr:small ribosomal subunit biogenesis GTPase RsgA [Pseudomonadota bacterium]
MSKRKLSRAQKARIAEKQKRELIAHKESEDALGETPQPQCNGRIISHFGAQLDVENLDPAADGEIIRCHQRANLPPLVTGDLVVWKRDEAHTGVILALGDRQNLFGRVNAAGQLKLVASNVDIVLLVIAPLPQAFMNLIDRYLVAIESLHLQALLVMNKLDLLKSDGTEEMDKMLSVYEKIGYEIHRVSATDGQGIESLENALEGKTTVLVGQSGVGKSALINRFGLEPIAKVGELSSTHAQGTHTTTTAKLFHLPRYDLIDSPGIREFSLGQVSQQQLFDGFREMKSLANRCKFRDCSHQSEPDCAIRQAVVAGEIHPLRLASYFQILQSIDSNQ